jgi:ABC-type antimicrobial peptide transport system permease subunit
MALGAQGREIVGLVTREGVVVVLVGSVFGVIGALMSTRLLASLLYGVGATDTNTFIVAPAVLLLVAFAACWIPASKAVGVSPLEAVRCQKSEGWLASRLHVLPPRIAPRASLPHSFAVDCSLST